MTITDERQDYARELVLKAPRERLLEAFTTLDGLAGWWTSAVSGDPSVSGTITFRFGDQRKVMQVDKSTVRAVTWTCIEDNHHREWAGTRIIVQLEELDGGKTLMRFRHEGLMPELECYGQCEAGWDYFMASIAAYVESGEGSPWRPSL
jgi:uncharacterized protein YndB with AHSA1/START domain